MSLTNVLINKINRHIRQNLSQYKKMMKSQNHLTQNILVQENDWSKNNHKIILKKKLHNFNFLAIKY